VYRPINLTDVNIKVPLEGLQCACFMESTYVDIWCLFVCFCWNFENIKLAKTHRPDVAFLSNRVTCLFHLHCLSVFWIDACVLFSSVSAVNSNSVRAWINICQPDWLLLSISWTISVVLFVFRCHCRRSTHSKGDAEFKKCDEWKSGIEWSWVGLLRERLPQFGVQFHLPSNETFQYAVSVLID
jgi:hypothetical protein